MGALHRMQAAYYLGKGTQGNDMHSVLYGISEPEALRLIVYHVYATLPSALSRGERR